MHHTVPEIIYEDEAILICRKNAGIPVQTANAGRPDMVSTLKNYRVKNKEEPYIGVVHRLDQPVEGVMVFAKTKEAAAYLSKQVSSRTVDKQYMAVLCGVPEQEGKLCDYLLRDGRTNISSVVAKDTAGAKIARLSYERLAVNREENCSLVRITLYTGRHHQIRVQFSHAGYPLYADAKYGQPLPDGAYCPVALCSCKIGFQHPVTKKKIEFEIIPRGKGFERIFPEYPSIL